MTYREKVRDWILYTIILLVVTVLFNLVSRWTGESTPVPPPPAPFCHCNHNPEVK